jgi:hypothetical protein
LIALGLGVVCVAGLAWAWWAPQRRDRAVARDFVRRLRESNGCSGDYANPDRLPWKSLANAERSTLSALFRQLRQEVGPEHELYICPLDMGQLMGLALGVDHDGTRSRAMLSEFLLPALAAKAPVPPFMRWMLGSPRLRVEPAMVPKLFDLELRRIEQGSEVLFFHERSNPTEYPTLGRWADELVRLRAVGGVRSFFPRLLALLKTGHSVADGTLDRLAPLLEPDQAATVLSTALEVNEGFGRYGEWYLGSLVARLEGRQTEALLPAVLREFERQSAQHAGERDAANRFRSWGTVLASLANKLGPAQRTQLAQAGLRLLAKEDGARLSVLILSVLPVLGPLDREQVTPVLHPWLEQLPSHVKDRIEELLAFTIVGEHAVEWLDKADPADVSRAAHGMGDVLVADAARGSVSSYVAEALGAWGPLLSPGDAFEIVRPLAQAMAKPHPRAGLGGLFPAIEKLSGRLSSTQALTIARILMPAWQAADDDLWLRGRLAVCLKTLAHRLDKRDRHTFDAIWGDLALSPNEAASLSDSEREAQYDQEIVRELTKGEAMPSAREAPSAYVQAWLGLWLPERNQVRRAALVRELVRATSAQPSPMAQLYLNLLKDYQVDADDWRCLVRALHTAAQRPAEGSLWDLLAWTQQDPAGRALGLDWASPPPWR